jgi:hypothetical protein
MYLLHKSNDLFFAQFLESAFIVSLTFSLSHIPTHSHIQFCTIAEMKVTDTDVSVLVWVISFGPSCRRLTRRINIMLYFGLRLT